MTDITPEVFRRDDLIAELNTPGRNSRFLCVLNVDFLMIINDAYGYDRLDQMLSSIASEIASLLGPEQPLYRTCGGEFAFLTKDTDKSKLELLINNIRSVFEKYTFSPAENSNLKDILKRYKQEYQGHLTARYGAILIPDATRLFYSHDHVISFLPYQTRKKGADSILIIDHEFDPENP
jgi:GGDEF domain-containing protein